MQPGPDFVINLDDPADLTAKRDFARKVIADMKMQLATLQEIERQIAVWEVREAFIESQLPPDLSVVIENTPEDTRREVRANRERPGWLQELVVDVVNREVRKIRSKEVQAILAREGHEVTAEQVSNALHYAAHGAKPSKIQDAAGRGMYAPLAYREVELTPPVVMGAVTNGAMISSAENGGTIREDAGDFGGVLPGK